MINGSLQRKSTTKNTGRYCVLCTLCGYKPFREIIKSLRNFQLTPLNEQKRIVAKVDQFVILCNELE